MSDQCDKCKKEVSTPFGIYHDPQHEVNVWGGDTYETRVELCANCALKLIHEVKGDGMWDEDAA